jgi:hypothetical protein
LLKSWHRQREALHLMLVTRDPALVATVSELSRDQQIQTSVVSHALQACGDVRRTKFEGVLLDCDSVSGTAEVLVSLLESTSNRNAVVVTIATGKVSAELQKYSHFLLRRPWKPVAIRKTFGVVHSLMQREFRRYFRLSVELPITLQRKSGERLNCTTTNISRTGVAVTCPRPLKPAEEVSFEFVLPGRAAVSGTGEVIWDDKHGKSGLRLRCRTPQMRLELEAWLDLCASETEGLTP